MEVHILYILYRGKHFKINAGHHSEKLKKIIQKKYNHDFEKGITHLKNTGYITAIKKTELKYYILDLGKAYSVLKSHGYNVTPLGGSRTHHIE
ncbi:MAG: hypothetical protein WC379_00705 [Methanoregula sp.]